MKQFSFGEVMFMVIIASIMAILSYKFFSSYQPTDQTPTQQNRP